MSTYGLKIINPNSELVVSSDAQGLYCVGKATFINIIQPSGDATSDSPGRVSGYSVYRIAHPSSIIPVIDLPINKSVNVISVSLVSSGLWEIVCYCGSGSDTYGFETQSALDVWAYGTTNVKLGDYGLALYNSSGVLTHDFTRDNILFPRAYQYFTSQAFSIPTLSRPVILGFPYTTTSNHLLLTGNNSYEYKATAVGWNRASSTTVNGSVYTTKRYQYNSTEPRGGSDDHSDATSCFVIEGSGFPN